MPDPRSGAPPGEILPGRASFSFSEDDLAAVRARMLDLVRRVCPRWLADQAEDVVQTAMARVLDMRRKSGGDFEVGSSYLMKAAYCAAVDEIRLRFRKPERMSGGTLEMDVNPSGGAGPEREASAREIDRGIRECLAALPRPRKLAVTLHLLGYSFAESGRRLGWSLKRTEHLTYRGLTGLRRCLEQKGLTL